jgi:biotin carboxyl carrier protein
MSGDPDPALAAVSNARALLASVLAGGWRELYIASGSFEIFIAADGAGSNPMRTPAAAEPASDAGQQISVNAPHVATLVAVAPRGTRIAKGETLATISVLGDEIAVLAPSAGVVGLPEAAIGALVEFDQPIVGLCEDSG